ncbi:MAG: DUF2256 domain-containing protein [Oceanospirillaceae bacterium]|nr:DUF2256 domain-containing protein [Oceanospirillaceae bacterium]
MVKKGDLPQKICQTCNKPYAWRKKWARDWANIRYCSQRCKSEAKLEINTGVMSGFKALVNVHSSMLRQAN